jgi:glycine cleavage system H protein
MSILIGLCFAIILILWSILRQEKTKSEPVIITRYLHPGHAWFQVTEDGDALVGIDQFAQSVCGRIDEVKLPRTLQRLEQGAISCHISHNGRVIPIQSPITGRVTEKNEMVIHDPSLINNSPYGDGWLFRVRPIKMRRQLQNL